ncbi:DNA-directed RNA polymerase subunit beta [Oceanobacillus jeddahense]|uniref:DNA-directed RNA polymerase subunit beta n=1 Tax=Oceanobacillus jeddahense TaxID=1462527 RepID=A0ABY5JVI3_9BACI|nr:DNA-directed RNA polymerase subunit beta [Oceanobacillus jeddahense]UUI02589.1 DNA-directed RNA polymerase subunit beta [Oceanobacillus jeddahense]
MTQNPSSQNTSPKTEQESAAASEEQEIQQETSRKKERKGKQQRKRRQKLSKPRLRIFPIWLRIIVILIFAVTAFVIGLMIGFAVLGDGSPLEVLRLETWQHIIDIVNKTD